jgi:hypothetical protein
VAAAPVATRRPRVAAAARCDRRCACVDVVGESTFTTRARERANDRRGRTASPRGDRPKKSSGRPRKVAALVDAFEVRSDGGCGPHGRTTPRFDGPHTPARPQRDRGATRFSRAIRDGRGSTNPTLWKFSLGCLQPHSPIRVARKLAQNVCWRPFLKHRPHAPTLLFRTAGR